MKKIIIPSFLAVSFFFVAQVAFKIPSLIRCNPDLLTREMFNLPLSLVAIAAADTIGFAGIVAAGIAFATIIIRTISQAEAGCRKANKS